jgi:DNA-binding LacI/PurR family transcriptional regulator
VVDRVEESLMYEFALTGLDSAGVRRLISIGRTPSQARDLQRQWDDYRRRGRFERLSGDAEADRSLRRNMSGVKAILDHGFDGDFLERACISIFETAGVRAFRMTLRPLFERALRQTDATAWICGTDGTALEALSFLRGQKVRVPRDLSVVGFDNAPVRAIEERLTTLDFNPMGFVHGMLNFIVRPSRPRGRYRHAPIEVDGVIIERDTTAQRRRMERGFRG